MLDYLLNRLYQTEHVEIIRLGTRTPVTLPQRITPELCKIIKKYPPIYINTQFNHPLEVTPEAKLACDRLIEAGAVLGNQAVLLRGINDRPYIMRRLNHKLLQIRVRALLHLPCQRCQRHQAFSDQYTGWPGYNRLPARPYLRSGSAYLYSQCPGRPGQNTAYAQSHRASGR